MSFNPKLFQHLLDVLFYAVGRVIIFFFRFYAAGRVLFFLKKIFCLYFLCMHCECEAHFLQYLSLMSVHIIILPSLLYPIPPPPASLHNLRPFSSPS